MVEISAHSRGNTIAEFQKLCENAEDRQDLHVWSESLHRGSFKSNVAGLQRWKV